MKIIKQTEVNEILVVLLQSVNGYFSTWISVNSDLDKLLIPIDLKTKKEIQKEVYPWKYSRLHRKELNWYYAMAHKNVRVVTDKKQAQLHFEQLVKNAKITKFEKHENRTETHSANT